MANNAIVRIHLLLFIRTFCLLAFADKIGAYEVPPAIVEPLAPVGLRVSIPDHPGVTLFAFHGNVNEDFENGREAGQMAVDVLRKKNGFWTYTNRNIKLKEGDIIYYWLYVIKDDLGYERLFQSHLVDGFFPDENIPTPPRITTTKKPLTTKASTTERPIIFTTEGSSRPNDPVTRNPGPIKCGESITTVNGKKACSGYLIFESTFGNEIGKNWTNEVHFNDYDESEFVVFDNEQSNSFAESNYLTIRPSLLDDYYGLNFTTDGSLDITARCTSYEEELCKRERFSFIILPPVISARLTTKESFSFKYGIVEIKAKLPRGDWVVPEIWLEPKAHNPYGAQKSGKVVVAKSIGNTLLTHEGISIGNNLLTAGLEVNKTTQTFKKITNAGLWSDRFHVYKIEWTPSGISFHVDGEEFGKWVGKDSPLLKGHGPISPFDKEFYLLLGIHVGGYYDVPDGAMSGGRRRPKPWSNINTKRILSFYDDLKNWHATWNDKTKLQVEYIRVWAL